MGDLHISGEQFFQFEVLTLGDLVLIDLLLPEFIDHFLSEEEIKRPGIGEETGAGEAITQQLDFLQFKKFGIFAPTFLFSREPGDQFSGSRETFLHQISLGGKLIQLSLLDFLVLIKLREFCGETVQQAFSGLQILTQLIEFLGHFSHLLFHGVHFTIDVVELQGGLQPVVNFFTTGRHFTDSGEIICFLVENISDFVDGFLCDTADSVGETFQFIDEFGGI